MNSNIVKNRLSKSDTQSIIELLSPTKSYFGSEFSGKNIFAKKYLKLTGTGLDSPNYFIITANGIDIPVNYNTIGFVNSAGVTCGDQIYVDNTKNKVYFYKNIYGFCLKDYVNEIYMTKVYDTHATFEFNSSNTGVVKANGLDNIYCTHLDTQSSQVVNNTKSAIVGINVSGYIFLKFNSEDEKFFVNGKRIETVSECKEWIMTNSPYIWYERKYPEIIDITDTQIGHTLLNLNPENDFDWHINGGIGELCVYESIDDALNELRAMILE